MSAYLILSLIQQSNQYNGFQITVGYNGATTTELAHKGAAKTFQGWQEKLQCHHRGGKLKARHWL